MSSVILLYQRITGWLSGPAFESVALLMARLALAGIFWRSYKTKVVEGSWFEISDTTYFLFESEYAGVPLPAPLAAPMATYAEFTFPILLVLGLGTRFASLALLGMTLVIQFFVYPDAWWSVHFIWVALCLILIARGGGWLSLDAAANKVMPA